MFSKEFNNSYNYQLAPGKYAEYLSESNERYLLENKTILEPISDLLDYYDTCAVVVGSDGKKEKGIKVDTEVVFIQSEKSDRKLYPQYLADEFEKLTGNKYSDVFFIDKNLLPRIMKVGDNTLSFVDQNPSVVYPDRILNSILVCGQQMVYNQARQTVAIEMGLTPCLSGKIREYIKNQIREYLKVCQSGISRGAICFDFEKKCQYFDQKDGNIRRYGFKHGYIRLVQRKLDLKIQTMIRDRQIGVEKINNLPTNTFEKIDYLCPNQKPLIESYLWFLQNYHDIQKKYEEEKVLVEKEYDGYSFDINSEIILRNVEQL